MPKASPAAPQSLAPLELLVAAALFSSGGAAIKVCSVSGPALVAGRSIFAVVALLVLVPSSRRGWRWNSLPVAGIYAVTMILFVLSNKLTTAASVVFFQSTAPLYILVASPSLLGERIQRSDLALMAAMGAGLLFLISGTPAPQGTAPQPYLGTVLALLLGLGWAGVVMGLRRLASSSDSGAASAPSALAMGNLIACFACLPWAGSLADTPRADWLVMGYLGIFQIGAAYVFMIRGITRVPAFEASLLLLLEPVLSPLWAWSLAGEVPTRRTLVGGAIIVMATVAHAFYRSRKPVVARLVLAPAEPGTELESASDSPELTETARTREK